MNKVDKLVQKTLGKRLRPLTKEDPLSLVDLQNIRLTAIELLFDGLYPIFQEEHIVSIEEARSEVYHEIVAPAMDRIFDLATVEGYDRESMANTIGSNLSHIALELVELIERYKHQDADAYQEQFNTVY